MPQPVVSTIQCLTYSPPNTQRELRPARAPTSTSVAPKGEPGAMGALKGSWSFRAGRAGPVAAKNGARMRPAPRVRLLRDRVSRKDRRECREGEMILPLCTGRNGLEHVCRHRTARPDLHNSGAS